MRAEATFYTPSGPRKLLGDVIKRNSKTVWMKIDGGRTVKRHLMKHSVRIWTR